MINPSNQNFNLDVLTRITHHLIIILLQTDPNTAFLRSARAGQLDKLKEYLDSGTVRDINTSNAVSLITLRVTHSLRET